MRHQIGEEGVLARDVTALCCGCVIHGGTHVKIRQRTSQQPGVPRIVVVECDDSHSRGLHKVKVSEIWFVGEVHDG